MIPPPPKAMYKLKLLYAFGLLVNSSLSLTIHSTSSSIVPPSVAHPLDDNTYFYPHPTPVSNCELTFSTDEYTTTVAFSYGCPTGSVTPPPNFPPTVPYGCTYFASRTYCPYNCDTSLVHYYDYLVQVTSCPEQLCIFDKSGGRPSFKCEPTTLTDSWSSYIPSEVSNEVSATPDLDSISHDNSTWHDSGSTDRTTYYPKPEHPMTTKMPVTCELKQTSSQGNSWNDVSCNYFPTECTKATTFNVHNQTVTYIWCPSTTIELFSSGETTTTFCPFNTCYDYLDHTDNSGNTRVDNSGFEVHTTRATLAATVTANAGTVAITKTAATIDTICTETKTMDDRVVGGHGHAQGSFDYTQNIINTDNIPIYKTKEDTDTDCYIITTCPTPVTLTVTHEITRTETVTEYKTLTANDHGDICIVSTTNEVNPTRTSYRNQAIITSQAVNGDFYHGYPSKPNYPDTWKQHGTEKATTTETPETSVEKPLDESETSGEKPADKPVDESVDKPADEPIVKPNHKPTDNPIRTTEPITSTIGNYSIDYRSTTWRNSSTLVTTVVN